MLGLFKAPKHMGGSRPLVCSPPLIIFSTIFQLLNQYRLLKSAWLRYFLKKQLPHQDVISHLFLYYSASLFSAPHLDKRNPMQHQFWFWDLFMTVANHCSLEYLATHHWRIALIVCYNRKPIYPHSGGKSFNTPQLLPPYQSFTLL